MKKRVISAIIALLIVIPLIIVGSYFYKIGVGIIGLIGFYEMLNARDQKKKIPILVKIISYVCFILFMINNAILNNLSFNIYYIAISILVLFIPIIFYEDNAKYNIEDATFLFTASLFLGIGFNILMNIRDYSLSYFILLLLITTLSDTFAYIIGMLIGKHKLSPKISPKKSVEGFIGGLVMSTFVVTSFYINIFSYEGNILYVILIVGLLSIISTLGDLFFSSVKRNYEIKDFGNIMPGHGGILDRLDSLLLVLIAFMLIIGML